MLPNESRRSFLKKSTVTGAAATAMLANFGSGLQAAVNNTPQSSDPSDLKITDLKCARIGGTLYVRIFTNQGITGTGEGNHGAQWGSELAIWMGEQLLGKNPLDVNRLYEEIRRLGNFRGAQSGIYICVLTAVETALWDVTGKALGLPLYRLLGGKFRDRIRLYCDIASSRETPEVIAATAVEAKNMGFNAVKFDLDWRNDPNKLDPYNTNASPGEVDRMIAQVAAAREAIGPHTDLCIDMHGRFDFPTGLRVAKALEPYNLMWLEDPVPSENFESLREVTRSTSTPICVGENGYLAYDLLKILEKKAADIIMPDIQKCGGVAEGQRIANLANLYYVPFAPHFTGSCHGAMIASHCCASIPNFLVMEFQFRSMQNKEWSETVIADKPLVEKGHFVLSDKPGIGLELNDEVIRRRLRPGESFFE